MNNEEYQRVAAELRETARSIEDAKRPAYTQGASDVLHNFKSVAERAGITTLQAWVVYFLKHVDSITSMAKDPSIPQAEALEGRFADAINYLYLGWAIVSEDLSEPLALTYGADPEHLERMAASARRAIDLLDPHPTILGAGPEDICDSPTLYSEEVTPEQGTHEEEQGRHSRGLV